MNNNELLAHLKARGVEAHIFTFDGGQTLSLKSGFLQRVTSEWGDPSLAELAARKWPHLFPEDDPFVIDQPVVKETY
jgi:hypothetical protein